MSNERIAYDDAGREVRLRPHVHEWESVRIVCRQCNFVFDYKYANRLERDQATLLAAATDALEVLCTVCTRKICEPDCPCPVHPLIAAIEQAQR